MTINCVIPPELDDRQLLAYLDGKADQETISHVQSCAYCRHKAEKLDHFQKDLITQLYRQTCPSPMELGEYHFHLSQPSQMLIIRQHLRECPHCARELAQLESFLGDRPLKPENGMAGRAKLLIARLAGSQELTFTSASAALRGEGRGPLTFAVDGIVIALNIQPAAAGRMNILGQVAADDQDDWNGAPVELRQDEKLQATSTVDDLGAFHCEGIMPGQQELRITSRNGSIVVMANFEVPAKL